MRYYDFYNCNHLILWYWQASTKQFMLSHDSWKVSWFANYGMSAVWELQYVKKNMMNSATFGPKSFAQLRNICYFFNSATLFYGLSIRLSINFILIPLGHLFSFCHLVIFPLKNKFDHFFTWLVIHLVTLRTNLGKIALGHFFHLAGDSLDHWLHLFTWLYKRQIYHNSIKPLFALGQPLYLPPFDVQKLSLGTLLLLDKRKSVAELCAYPKGTIPVGQLARFSTCRLFGH